MIKPPSGAAVVHTNQSHPMGSSIARPWIDGSWPLRGNNPRAWADYLAQIALLAAAAYRMPGGHRTLTIIDIRRVVGFTISSNRVNFSTVQAPDLEHLVGSPSPVLWKRSERWPIKVIDQATLLATGNQLVS